MRTDDSEHDLTRRLTSLGEDSHWEFKQIEFTGDTPRAPKRDDLADEIAAFANARGGFLLCGVTDDGEVQGMSRNQMDNLERVLSDACSDSIKPPVEVDISREELDGRPFLIVSIPEGEAQHDSPGGSYRRIGSSRRKMSSDERLRLAQRRRQAHFLWFDKQPLPETGFNTLNESLWKPLLSAEGLVNPEPALQKMALLLPDKADSIRATVSGVLLCTPNPAVWLPNACITATCYRGADRASTQLDSRNITGPLNQQIAEAVAFVKRNSRVTARKEPGRVDIPEYSDKAVFEALVNAVVHRDYSIRGSAIRLSMFKNRLEIQSPGSLPNNLTVESMLVRQVTRNEALTSILGRMPVGGIPGSSERQYFMERRGDGISIIHRETRELCGTDPEYEVIDDTEVCLTIPAATLTSSPAHTTITVHDAGKPLVNADILALFPNKTWKRTSSDEHGEVSLELHSTHLPMTVFAAAYGFAAFVEYEWTPSQHALSLELQVLAEGGSVIFPEATGHLPGIKGKLNPIRDTHDRTYLYASNISINQGQQQPVYFSPGEEMRLTDINGNERLVRIIDIVGRSALVEYRSCPEKLGRSES